MIIKQANLAAMLAMMLTITACQKNDPNISTDLLGRWKLRKVYISAGGALVERNPVDTSLYVQFNSDGSLQGSAYPDVKGFNIIDTANISLIRSNHDATTYAYGIKLDTLTLASTACVEGCPMKFVKGL